MAVGEALSSHLVSQNQSVRFYSDIVTTVYGINKQGSSYSLQITEAVAEIRSICAAKNLTLELYSIPGHLNVLAETL